jgi:putative spermidine/putrescine transport system ATP-binding protein
MVNPNTSLVEIRNLTKRFGSVAAVDRVTLSIASGEFFALLGPSGCGKTTLLRMIAGLETPTEGTIHISGHDVTSSPPSARPLNLVFQHYALFPHLSVERNVSFGLRYRGIKGSEAARRVDEALRQVRLEGLGLRYPHQLSGGQRQRVALARALVLRPQVLLLDEPLGALDQKLRREMQIELKHLQRTLGITFIFVTHDQEEALTMSDRIAVMNGGRVEQVDAAHRVFEYPETEFVAQFMGAANFFRRGEGDSESRFIVRPEKLRLERLPLHDGDIASMTVTIEDRIYQGQSSLFVVASPQGERFNVYRQNSSAAGDVAEFKPGETAHLCWRLENEVPLKTRQPGRAEGADHG